MNSRHRSTLALIACLVWAFAGCEGDSIESPRSAEANWFARCTSDAACSDGTRCLCGICTLTCADDSACDPANNLCAKVGSRAYATGCSHDAPEPGICLHKCPSEGCGSGLTCVEGLCARASSADVDSGGTGAGGSARDAAAGSSSAGHDNRDASVDGAGGAGGSVDASRDAHAVTDTSEGAAREPDGGIIAAKSCVGLTANCGASAKENCCASPLVTGGTFYPSYDGMTDGYKVKGYPATVSDFRLDRFEITVGRFRKFVAAWDAGYRPPEGAGKHVHLNGGKGLAQTGGGFEPGWDASWNAQLATTSSGWDAALACSGAPPPDETWTPAPSVNETRPIGCASWYELAAFCIWDGGFLPSEVEWNYAASGGGEQRRRPWETKGALYGWDCAHVACSPTSTVSVGEVGSVSPLGDGKYGQADLVGNVFEWTLDWLTAYPPTCIDCAYTSSGTNRVFRGGDGGAEDFLSAARGAAIPSYRHMDMGARCARSP